MCVHFSVKDSRLLFDSTIIKRSKYSHLKCSLQILSFRNEIWASSSVSTVKLSLKDFILIIVFKLLEPFFFSALEAITIAAANCKTSFMRESSVTCNALWNDSRQRTIKKGTFFKILSLHKLSHKELLCQLRIQVEKYYNCVF